MKILLVEDDIMLNEMITEYITSTGHAIKSVKTGNESLEILDKEKFDLLILDINLPDIDGFTILEKMHEQKRMIPTIYISALIDIEDISRAFDLGCFDYLKKPFHLKELTLRINKILKTRIVPQRHKRLSKHYSFDSFHISFIENSFTFGNVSGRVFAVLQGSATPSGFIVKNVVPHPFIQAFGLVAK